MFYKVWWLGLCPSGLIHRPWGMIATCDTATRQSHCLCLACLSVFCCEKCLYNGIMFYNFWLDCPFPELPKWILPDGCGDTDDSVANCVGNFPCRKSSKLLCTIPHQVKCVLSCSWADLFICFKPLFCQIYGQNLQVDLKSGEKPGTLELQLCWWCNCVGFIRLFSTRSNSLLPSLKWLRDSTLPCLTM